MKSIVKIVILIAIILAFSFMHTPFMDNTDIQASDQAEWSEEGSEGFNGFTVVEIVPYKGMGEIGYLIGGQEPVDSELLNYNNHLGPFSSNFGGAISTYRSYKEGPLPSSGNPDPGWTYVISYELQNGYFEYVASGGADLYRRTNNQTVYVWVGDGTGTHRAALPSGATLTVNYDWGAVNMKNVNARFIHEDDVTDTGLLFSSSRRYEPYSVTKSPDHTGDYDYDPASWRFILNEGSGQYDVIFKSYTSGEIYYMLNNYDIVPEGTGVYSFDGSISYTAQAGGNYRRYTNAPVFTYEQWWGGNYRWVQDDTALTKNNFQTEGNRIWVQGHKVSKKCQVIAGLELVNNEWFKLISLGVPPDMVYDYPVRVITITPEELNDPANHHYIDEANMFYINASQHNSFYITMYENCSYEGLSLPASEKYGGYNANVMNFAVHDTNWEVTVKLFKKIAGIGCAKACAVIDVRYFLEAVQGSTNAYRNYYRAGIGFDVNLSGQTGGTSVNLAKLYIMIVQRNMIDFYNSFMNPDKPESRLITVRSGVNSPTGVTGSFVRPNSSYSATSNNALYWNGNTFLPWGLDEDGAMTDFGSNTDDLKSLGITNYNITGQTTDLADNVLIMNGQQIFQASFIQPIELPEDEADVADEHLGSLDPDGSSGSVINIGNLVNVITNDGSGYDNTGGVSYPDGSDVEGPEDIPGDIPEDPGEVDDDGSGGSNLRTYKRVLNIQPTADFAASEADILNILSNYNVQIINMTSSQFNNSLEDINSYYDMIYMGSGYGRFNINTSNNSTNFNDNSLDRYFYFAVGDYIKWGNPSSLTQSRYTDDDITPQKRAELEAFLDAGFPIVLDSALYRLNDQNARVKNDTIIYDFISDNKSHTNLLNSGNYKTDPTEDEEEASDLFKNRLRNGLSITRPVIQLLEPLPTQDIYVDPVTDILTVRFKLLPRNGVPSYYRYNAYLYVDRNADGIFEEADRLETVSSGGSSWENVNESNVRIFTYQYDMSDMNGVYQWKLMIERADNTNIRGCTTGYCANTIKEDIYILHLRENTSTYDMDALINDTSKLINTYAGAGALKDYNLHFTSKTLQEYEGAFSSAPYNSAEWETTGKLSGYHLLILDNPSTPINPANGAVANIRDEITRNLSVVYTKGALGYANQDDYYNSSGYSFIDHADQANEYRYTYGYLSNNSDPGINTSLGQNLIYRDMVGENGVTELYSDAAYITTYMTRANEGCITSYPYKLDSAVSIAAGNYSDEAIIRLDTTQNKRLIVWYCLSDSRSPIVRNKFGLGGSTNDLYKGIYSSSPNDPQNNYYLFSNGLCFYSGISLSSADHTGNDDEMKLFVNTLITAYSTSRRIVSRPPVVEITTPAESSVIISQNDLTNGEYIVKFEITESSTNMDLSIKYGGETEPAGSWDDIVYEAYVNGTFGDPIAINNLNKVIAIDKTYAIKIPADRLFGTNELIITAKNAAGNTGFDSLTINYVRPPVVTITDPVPSVNGDDQYIYLDIDFSADIEDVDYLANAPMKRIEFTVSEAMTANVMLGFVSEGHDLSSEGIEVYSVAGGVEIPIDISVSNPQGSYALYIPMTLMASKNIRVFTISAADTMGTAPGSTAFILLRRSMFPLD